MMELVPSKKLLTHITREIEKIVQIMMIYYDEREVRRKIVVNMQTKEACVFEENQNHDFCWSRPTGQTTMTTQETGSRLISKMKGFEVMTNTATIRVGIRPRSSYPIRCSRCKEIFYQDITTHHQMKDTADPSIGICPQCLGTSVKEVED